MSYDTKCADLAEAFLEDVPHVRTEARVKLLAQRIQDVIEEDLADWEEEAARDQRESDKEHGR